MAHENPPRVSASERLINIMSIIFDEDSEEVTPG